MLLTDRTAIVTGGGKGIGRAIALALAREGADVVVAATTESALQEVAAEIKTIGRKSLVIVADLADPGQPQSMVEKTIEAFGKVDVLVNNSGVEGPIANITDMDLEGWSHTIAVNLTGAMLCTKHALVKSMIPRKTGAIVNISSVSGRKGPPMRAPYSSSKFGMIGLTQSVAMEAGRHGIRVNCIAPGLVEGDRIERVLSHASRTSGRPYEEVVAMATARTALRRMVTPEEVAALTVFLASDLSSGVTGQTINCDAGMELD